jgi:hypothetical protein
MRFSGFAASFTQSAAGSSATPVNLLRSVSRGPASVGADDPADRFAVHSLAAEERVEVLVLSGQTRREALRQVARENVQEEIRDGLLESFQTGVFHGHTPTDELETNMIAGCARAFGTCCGVLFLVCILISLLVCIVVYTLHKIFHVVGWIFLAWWLTGSCEPEQLVWNWLAVYQAASLAELLAAAVLHVRWEQVEEALDGRARPGFARACCVIYNMVSTGLKVFWCIHVEGVISALPKQSACGDPLPRFVGVFTVTILLELLLVEPLVRVGGSLGFWLAAGGRLQARAARPGTLESMELVSYNESIFADADDPSDARPQGECCICLQEYSQDEVIVKTACQHYMHRECLSRWLRSSYHCPICRGDLEESIV